MSMVFSLSTTAVCSVVTNSLYHINTFMLLYTRKSTESRYFPSNSNITLCLRNETKVSCIYIIFIVYWNIRPKRSINNINNNIRNVFDIYRLFSHNMEMDNNMNACRMLHGHITKYYRKPSTTLARVKTDHNKRGGSCNSTS